MSQTRFWETPRVGGNEGKPWLSALSPPTVTGFFLWRNNCH